MRIIKNMFLIIVLLIFNSCSISTSLFIQNLLQEETEIKIIYSVPISKFLNDRHYKMLVVHELISPKEFYSSGKEKEIEQNQINDSTLVFTIPKNSTIRIAGATNAYFRNYIEYVEINNKKIFIDKLISKSYRKRGTFTYKIEK